MTNNFGLVPKSDYDAAVGALQTHHLEEHGHGKLESGNARKREELFKQCTERLIQSLNLSISPISDNEFHSLLRRCHPEGLNSVRRLQRTTKFDCTESKTNKGGNSTNTCNISIDSDGDETSSFEFDDDELLDLSAIEQVQGYRKQSRAQAHRNSLLEAQYFQRLKSTLDREVSFLRRKYIELSCLNDYERNDNVSRNAVGTEHEECFQEPQCYLKTAELIRHMKERLAKLETTGDSDFLSRELNNIAETIEEIERTFATDGRGIFSNADGNEFAPALSQVDEAIVSREEHDAQAIQHLKFQIMESALSDNIQRTDEKIKFSPNKIFLNMMNKCLV